MLVLRLEKRIDRKLGRLARLKRCSKSDLIREAVVRLLEDEEDRALHKAWLESATKTRRQWVQENPY